MKIRLGTRASLLARTQSGWVADQLRALEPGLEIEEVLKRCLGEEKEEDLSEPPAAAVVASNGVGLCFFGLGRVATGANSRPPRHSLLTRSCFAAVQ